MWENNYKPIGGSEMKKLLIVLAVVMTISMVGCTGGKLDLAKFDNWFNTNTNSIQTTVYLATDLLLRGKPAEAQKITDLVDMLKAAITTGRVIKVNDIQPFIDNEVKKLKLLPEDVILVKVLMTKLQPEIVKTLTILNLKNPSDQLVEINKILGYVTDVSSVIK
jgi:hypothetical protein